MALYQLTGNPDIVQRNDGNATTFIPRGHPQFTVFQSWQMAGNIADPAPPIVPPAPPEPRVSDVLALLVARSLIAQADATAVLTQTPIAVTTLPPIA